MSLEIHVATCVCFKRLKLNEMTFNYIVRFLPSFFNFECAYILADSSKGGQLIAWKKQFQLLNSWATQHTLTVLLHNQCTDENMTYTTVYRPSVDVAKPNFIAELYEVASKIEPSWIIAGDFNLVRWLIDRSREYRGFGLMDSFNDYISVAGLNDVPLKKSHLHVVKKDTNTKVLKAGLGIYHYGSSIKIPGYHSRSARNGCIGSCPVTSIVQQWGNRINLVEV